MNWILKANWNSLKVISIVFTYIGFSNQGFALRFRDEASNQKLILSGKSHRCLVFAFIAIWLTRPIATSEPNRWNFVWTWKLSESIFLGISIRFKQSPVLIGARKSASQCTIGKATSGLLIDLLQVGNTSNTEIPYFSILSSQASWHQRNKWWKWITPAASVSPKRTQRLKKSQSSGLVLVKSGISDLLNPWLRQSTRGLP